MKHCDRCHLDYDRFAESDPCLGNLPGVLFGCCGHGKEDGYLLFSNGVRLRFQLIESKVNELPPSAVVEMIGGGKEPSLPKTTFSVEFER